MALFVGLRKLPVCLTLVHDIKISQFSNFTLYFCLACIVNEFVSL